ncbi:hypothetical protein [Caballeronia hypogeia]|uniref:hypothetical protein n=1 Tax=Caballeronia hypogeia TaxID=1777140 RepID=UPI0012FE636E|nr:hypothetical protein [Caballeronia hypogeia]
MKQMLKKMQQARCRCLAVGREIALGVKQTNLTCGRRIQRGTELPRVGRDVGEKTT